MDQTNVVASPAGAIIFPRLSTMPERPLSFARILAGTMLVDATTSSRLSWKIQDKRQQSHTRERRSVLKRSSPSRLVYILRTRIAKNSGSRHIEIAPSSYIRYGSCIAS